MKNSSQYTNFTLKTNYDNGKVTVENDYQKK